MRTFAKPNFAALATFAKEAEEREKNSEKDGIRFTNLEVGGNEFIVCPPYNDRGLFVKKVFKHWGLGQEGKNSVECPELSDHADGSLNKKCPVCTAIRLIVQNNRMGLEEERKSFGALKSQGKTYVNAKILMVGGKKVTNDEDYSLPRIIRGPSKLADHIWQKLYEHKFSEMSEEEIASDDYSNELVFSIKKIEKTVKGKPNTSYEYGLFPGRKKLASDEDELEEIIKNVYDLDIVFKNIWTLEKYAASVSYANLLLSKYEYAPLEMEEYYNLCPPPVEHEEKEDKNEGKKKIDTGKKISTKVEKKVVEEEENTEEDNSSNEDDATPEPPKPTAKKLDLSEKKSLIEKKLPKIDGGKSDDQGIVRDSSILGEDRKPLCYTYADTSNKECGKCQFLDSCLTKCLKKKMSRG